MPKRTLLCYLEHDRPRPAVVRLQSKSMRVGTGSRWRISRTLLDELPEHLIVGTGAAEQLRPGAHTLRRLRELGVRVEVLPTDQAVRRFGESNPAGTAAALHLTC